MANISYEGMRYDPFFGCVFMQIMQVKVKKKKLVPLIAGRTRHECWVLAWADLLVLDDKLAHDPSADSTWLLPEVHGPQAGTKMSSIVKGMQPAGNCPPLPLPTPLPPYLSLCAVPDSCHPRWQARRATSPGSRSGLSTPCPTRPLLPGSGPARATR